jgi:hypothetical protein
LYAPWMIPLLPARYVSPNLPSWEFAWHSVRNAINSCSIGIDLAKTVFHLIGLNAHGEVVVQRKCSRSQLLRFTSNLRVCLIGMEACGGAHFLGRALREQGHDVRLMPAQYVKPYVKTNKNDYIDAEAIAEAVGRPRIRFVPIKTATRSRSQTRNDSVEFVPIPRRAKNNASIPSHRNSRYRSEAWGDRLETPETVCRQPREKRVRR